MNKHVEDMISCCGKCLKYRRMQTKEPMQSREIPILPWQIFASDVLEHKNQNYLVVIDYYCYQMRRKITERRLAEHTCIKLVSHLKQIFEKEFQKCIASEFDLNTVVST